MRGRLKNVEMRERKEAGRVRMQDVMDNLGGDWRGATPGISPTAVLSEASIMEQQCHHVSCQGMATFLCNINGCSFRK